MKSTLVFQKLKKIVEALLFAAKEPLTEEQVRDVTGVSAEAVSFAFEDLTAEYAERGIKILKVAHGYVFGTDPEFVEYVDRFRNFPVMARLSPQALETLAIVAYKQPITKPGVERIRGVFSDGVIETLINRGLIEECGRSDAPGRPILYRTTIEFLKHFGIKDLNDLPAMPENISFEGILEEKVLVEAA